MNIKRARFIFVIGGLFLLLDRLLKWQVTHDWSQPHLLFPGFGWELFYNTGAAFGLPLGNTLIILFTVVILAVVLHLLIKELGKQSVDRTLLFAWSLIIYGALSNLADRLFYAYVIDYILLGTAIINIADIMIVTGLGIYTLKLFRAKQ